MACNCQQGNPSRAAPAAKQGKSSSSIAKPLAPVKTASIRYTGPTAVAVTGTASGRHYRFSATGATVQIDQRDKAALARVPHLRQI